VVTIDALGCQKEIAQQIMDQGADYVLAWKENQAGLYAAVVDLFEYAHYTDFTDCDYYKTVDKGHGRIEIRQCRTTSAAECPQFLPNRLAWPSLHTLVMARAERRMDHETTVKFRYYISSLATSAQPHLDMVRGDWSINNQVHWVLDVAFR
jgi:predicted transposase YbfD/YdcC